MSNVFRSDLKILKQLEQTIGKEIPELNKIAWYSVGHVQNAQNQIIGLCLYNCGLKELPPEITKLQNLTSLTLSDNRLTEFPKELF